MQRGRGRRVAFSPDDGVEGVMMGCLQLLLLPEWLCLIVVREYQQFKRSQISHHRTSATMYSGAPQSFSGLSSRWFRGSAIARRQVVSVLSHLGITSS